MVNVSNDEMTSSTLLDIDSDVGSQKEKLRRRSEN